MSKNNKNNQAPAKKPVEQKKDERLLFSLTGPATLRLKGVLAGRTLPIRYAEIKDETSVVEYLMTRGVSLNPLTEKALQFAVKAMTNSIVVPPSEVKAITKELTANLATYNKGAVKYPKVSDAGKVVYKPGRAPKAAESATTQSSGAAPSGNVAAG
jgi:hypothetical protein